MKLRDLLKIKGREVISIGPDEMVSTAINKLAQYDRGSLPVCNDKGEIVGIITERDILRKCLAQNDSCSCANYRIKDVMTTEVAIGLPDDDLDYAVSVMKQKRIRHLPIMENHRVVGLVSMRDLLDMQLTESKAEIRYAGLIRRGPRHIV